MLLKLIAAVEGKEEFTVTLLDCMYLLQLAWENVSAKTIANSFLHCGFQAPEESLPCPQETEEDPSTLGEALLSRLGSYSADLPEGVMFQEFISVDSQVNTTGTLPTEDIVATVKLNNEDHDDAPTHVRAATLADICACMRSNAKLSAGLKRSRLRGGTCPLCPAPP